ncbi:MAG: hypothetical protein HKN12_03705, partial [Gemmatimonadetes bacterium]|nr:hypothetical protein [Gemmatimonadota bacterium]
MRVPTRTLILALLGLFVAMAAAAPPPALLRTSSYFARVGKDARVG